MQIQNIENRLNHQTFYRRFRRFEQKSEQKRSKIVGNYKIGSKLGQGLNGHVYSAYRWDNNKKFALKILPKTKDTIIQVANEVKILTETNHQNIVKIEEVIEQADKTFIFMEHCPKRDLLTLVNEEGQLSEEMAAKIFIKIYSALEYLHEHGITHRDVKAQNILLTEKMDPKLTDFGLSRYYEKDAMLETWCGSFSYKAPEILKHKKYKPELVDLWSLCVTLYVMLVGKQPFNRGENKGTNKNCIITYNWEQSFHLSPEAVELFNLVFVPAHHRITLADVKQTAFYQKYCLFLKKKSSFIEKGSQTIQFTEFSTKLDSQVGHIDMKNQSTFNTSLLSSLYQANTYYNSKEFHATTSSSINQIIETPRKRLNRIDLLRMLKNTRGAKSVEPSNKFRIKSSRQVLLI